ncbi:MAG TPA: acyl-CoA thioesterase [Thermoanaerobacterales bacterium]|nr:acyl-CoA thioesterase [Thermoanaerobacterales bacterium]
MINDTIIRVRYKETDQMGIVYYANYLVWFEVARNEYFRKLGYTCRELELDGIFLPVIETHCKYKSPAVYDDEVLIKTWVGEFTGVRIVLYYEIYRKGEEKLLAEGYTAHAFVDSNGKPISIKKKNPDIWEAINKHRIS